MIDMSSCVITRLPLEYLWRGKRSCRAGPVRDLTEADICEMLSAAPVEFVTADLGHTLQWVEADKRFDFWKNELKPHLANGDRIVLEDFPGCYCYTAKEWRDPDSTSVIVVCEKHH